MKQKNWIIDIILLIFILGMGVLIFLEWDNLMASMRGIPESTSSEVSLIAVETPEPTLTPVRIVEQPSQNPPTDFELLNLDGEIIALSDYRGTPVMVNFWATWCPPCRAEMPLIQSFADKHGQGLVVLAVNAGEDEITVREFVEEYRLDLVFLLDVDELVVNQYLIRGFPTTLFIDDEGIIQAMHIGELDATLLTGYLRQIGVEE